MLYEHNLSMKYLYYADQVLSVCNSLGETYAGGKIYVLTLDVVPKYC
jgi:hypothetical protein